MIHSRRQTRPGASARLPDRYLDVDGARLRYRDEGAGPAVVFVHGWPLDLDLWEPQVAALSDTYRLIRWDRRGYGLSSGEPSLIDDIADLQALCRHLRLQRVAVVGMSQGARVALQAAIGSPATVSCLILDGAPRLAAAQIRPDPQELPYQDYRRLANTRGLAAFRREWLQHPLARLHTGDVEIHELLARMVARYPGKDLLDPLPGPSVITTASMIQSITAPVLVIGGAFDIDSRRQSADELALDLARAERVEIPNAGHVCNLDNPPAYASALRNFLELHVNTPTHH